MTTTGLRVPARDGGWVLAGADNEDVRFVNDYRGDLGDRALRTGHRPLLRVRLAGVLPLAGWPGLRIEAVDTAALLGG